MKQPDHWRFVYSIFIFVAPYHWNDNRIEWWYIMKSIFKYLYIQQNCTIWLLLAAHNPRTAAVWLNYHFYFYIQGHFQCNWAATESMWNLIWFGLAIEKCSEDEWESMCFFFASLTHALSFSLSLVAGENLVCQRHPTHSASVWANVDIALNWENLSGWMPMRKLVNRCHSLCILHTHSHQVY